MKNLIFVVLAATLISHFIFEPMTHKRLADYARSCRINGYELKVYYDLIRRPIKAECIDHV